MHCLPLRSMFHIDDPVVTVVVKTAQTQQVQPLQTVSPFQNTPNLHEASGGGLTSPLFHSSTGSVEPFPIYLDLFSRAKPIASVL